MPSQFQLRDLVNHVIIGCVVIFLFFLFLYLLYPAGWLTTVQEWHSVRAAISDVLLLPTLLILVYVVGAVLPTWSSLALFGTPKSFFFRTLRAVRVCRGNTPQDQPFKNEVKHLFVCKAARQFNIHHENLDEHFEELFALASAYVLSQGQSMQQLDIERHFVLMHFNSRLCSLFFLGFVFSVLGLLGSFLVKFQWVPALGAGTTWFLFLAVLFWAIARASGTKAQNNGNRWQRLIINSFVANH